MIELVNIADIRESNGKTVRENNYARLHTIPIGALVEIRCPDDDDEPPVSGIRLFVVKHTRDCDGTPLYSLGMRKDEADAHRMDHGWGEESLTIIPRIP